MSIFIGCFEVSTIGTVTAPIGYGDLLTQNVTLKANDILDIDASMSWDQPDIQARENVYMRILLNGVVWRWDVDNVRDGGVRIACNALTGTTQQGVTAGLVVGSNTIKLQWRSDAGTPQIVTGTDGHHGVMRLTHFRP